MSGDWGGAREGAGPIPKYSDPRMITVRLEGDLIDAMDAYREAHGVPRKTPGGGTRPMSRPEVISEALRQLMGIEPAPGAGCGGNTAE